MVPVYVVIIAAAAALLVGVIFGFLMRKLSAEKKLGSAEAQARVILEDAIKNAYKLVDKIHFENAYYRHDIGAKALLAKSN